MFLRPVEIEQTKERISVQSKSFDEPWEFNPYLAQTLTDRKITDPVLAPEQITRDPQRTIDHLALRLGPNAEVDKCYWLTNLSHLRAKLLNYFKTAQVLHGLANQRTLQRLCAHQPNTAPTVLQPPSAHHHRLAQGTRQEPSQAPASSHARPGAAHGRCRTPRPPAALRRGDRAAAGARAEGRAELAGRAG